MIAHMTIDLDRMDRAELVAALTAVLDLADELDVYVAARGRPQTGSYDDGVNRAQGNAADRIRSIVAAAGGDGE